MVKAGDAFPSGKIQVAFLCLIVLLASCRQRPSTSLPSANSPLPSVEESHSANGGLGVGILDLPHGSKFLTTLYALKVVGQLGAAHKLPYYILSGVGCNECDANVSIYIHSPSDGPMKNEGTQPRFDYPGRVISREGSSVASETKMFWGDCASGHSDAVIWFERYLGDDKNWHETVTLAEVKDDHLTFGEPKPQAPTVTEAENAVKKSRCRELSPGEDQWEEP